LIAWADESGVKIFDIEKLNRVAHIDRPSGARASLYPHISHLRPTLLFERSDSLLICWGDCLMNMIIKNSKDETKRISVKCEMAWELDCVGCDVQSIDAEFVAVLGLTSKAMQNDTDDEEQNKALMEQQRQMSSRVLRISIFRLLSLLHEWKIILRRKAKRC